MILDLTPSMLTVLASIGDRSACATELGVNGGVMKRLWELGFLNMDLAPEGVWPPYYSLSPKGEGAAAILNAAPNPPANHEAPIARIKRLVAAHYRVPAEEMTSARRGRKVARPRQVAMYLSKKLTPKSLPDIGRQFGGRDHTTVIHAIATIERLMVEDEEMNHSVRTLMVELVSEPKSRAVEKSVFSSFAVESTGA